MTPPARRESLTGRQREVLDLLAKGLTNAQIAERLGISLDGAKWHVSEVIGRLGVSSREEAALMWRMERRAWRRLKRVLAGVAVGRPTAIASAGGVAAVAVLVVVLLVATMSDKETSPTPAAIPTPPLPSELANPTVPTLVYVDGDFTEYPFPTSIVYFNGESGEEASRFPLGTVPDVVQVGSSIVGIREQALLQFDLKGAVFRTIYGQTPVFGFAVTDDRARAVVNGGEEAVIVDMATGDVLARVSGAVGPSWASGARFTWMGWLTGTKTAVVGITMMGDGGAERRGYVLLTENGNVEFRETPHSVDISRDGSMLLELPAESCAGHEGVRILETQSGDLLNTMPEVDGFRIEVFWSGRGTVVSQVAAEVEESDPCRQVAGTTVLWEDFDPRTGNVSPIDDVAAFVTDNYFAHLGEIELACGPDETLRATNGELDCSGNEPGFYFRGIPLNAANPRLFLGLYEP